MQDRLTYRPEEACAVLGIRRDLLFRLLKRGEIASLRVGRARLIPREALEQFIALRLEDARRKA